ncbi:MAG: hypothetical protein K2Y16_03765 [Burkholderiales bacterium]|nr:hypothetical protein [Burkholderiales bacterium]
MRTAGRRHGCAAENHPGGGLAAFEPLGSGASFQAALCDLLAESRAFSDLEGHEIAQLARYMQAYRGAHRLRARLRDFMLGERVAAIYRHHGLAPAC